MITVAVTGGIASGKSLAGKVLQEMGYTVIDTDIISRNLSLSGGEGYLKIVEAFGENIISYNGEIDRGKLANIVFNDKSSLDKLNNIMHPLIEKELFVTIEKHITEKIVFVLIPLLFESILINRFDKIWLILADEKIRIERAAKRDNSIKEEIKKRINNQINYEKMSNLAHTVLYNNSSEEEFILQVQAAVKAL